MDNHFQKEIGTKLVLAGWASSFNTKPGTMNITFTPRGHEQMKKIYECLNELRLDPSRVDEIDLLVGYCFVEAITQGWRKKG